MEEENTFFLRSPVAILFFWFLPVWQRW